MVHLYIPYLIIKEFIKFIKHNNKYIKFIKKNEYTDTLTCYNKINNIYTDDGYFN